MKTKTMVVLMGVLIAIMLISSSYGKWNESLKIKGDIRVVPDPDVLDAMYSRLSGLEDELERELQLQADELAEGEGEVQEGPEGETQEGPKVKARKEPMGGMQDEPKKETQKEPREGVQMAPETETQEGPKEGPREESEGKTGGETEGKNNNEAESDNIVENNTEGNESNGDSYESDN